MISISGFGSSHAEEYGYRYHVECASANRKGLEIVITLPRGYAPFKSLMREEVQKKMTRDRMHISITSEKIISSKTSFSILDQALARRASKELQQFQKSLHLSGLLTLKAILQISGVLENKEVVEVDLMRAWKPLEKALKRAL